MAEAPVTATLLISCRDQKGLVGAVSDFLYRNNGNIIHADQHTDLEEGIFVQVYTPNTTKKHMQLIFDQIVIDFDYNCNES